MILFNYNYSKYPKHLQNYVIYGKLDKKDKKTYQHQFKKKIYYKIDKYGNIIKKEYYNYKINKNNILISINKKKYMLKMINTSKLNVFNCIIDNRNVFLIKVQKMNYIQNLNGKIIKFINLISDKKNSKLKYQESIIHYNQKEYTEFNPFVNKSKQYNYFVNNYGKGYIINNREIIKLLYKTYNQGIFILKSGKKIIEGEFYVIN